MRKQGHSALRVNNGKLWSFDMHATAEAVSLTYEQEVHAMLCAAAANTEDLLRYFDAQAANESGEAKKLTLKCIAWKRDDLKRIHALIPKALEIRDNAKQV